MKQMLLTRRAFGLGGMALSAALAFTSPTWAAQGPAFTLPEVLQAPSPSYLTAAPKEGRVAWVYNKSGSRNVWVAEQGVDGERRARAITDYIGDDGFDLGELSWAASGRSVVYSRGGSLEGGGEETGGRPVNALSHPAGAPPRMVWVATVDGSAPRELAEGHFPLASPVGDTIAYLNGNQIWALSLSNPQPRQLTNIRGRIEEFAWSPDGGKLAFTSKRGTHTIVGVLDLERQAITWMKPGYDHDGGVEWSPDGRQLAFVRVPKQPEWNGTRNRKEATLPWSIWVCDVETGEGRRIWTAEPGRGSIFNRTLSSRVLFWTNSNTLLFPWERSGWLHMYSVPVSGGDATEITTGGEFEVFNTALSPDRSRLIYSSNHGDPDRYHLWSVSVDQARPQKLTEGRSIEDNPVIASDGQIYALHGTGRDPIRPTVLENGALTSLAPQAIPSGFPSDRLVEPEAVSFRAADGTLIRGQLFVPPLRAEEKRPAMLYFHGGPIRHTVLGWHPMGAYSTMYAMNQYLASKGYVVLSVNYRGGIGYGLDFRTPAQFRDEGASEYQDIVAAVEFLRARGDVDPRRVGAWGASYGGLMTALALSRGSDLVAAGVDYAGVHDWRARRFPTSVPWVPDEAAQLAFDSSAVSTVAEWRSPVLIAHADDDRNVPFDQSVRLVAALREQGVDVEELMFPDEIHDLIRAQSWLRLLTAADDFLDRKLVNRLSEGPHTTPSRAPR